MWGVSPAAPQGPLGWGAWLGLGCSGVALAGPGDRLLTAPTRTALGTAPFVDLELLGSEGSLGWGSEGRAEGDQDPQV